MWCLALSCLVFIAEGFYTNHSDVLLTMRRLKAVRTPEGVTGLSVAPFVWRGIKYVAFYPLAGLAVGALLAVLAHLLVRPKPRQVAEGNDDSGPTATALDERVLRKRFFWTFATVLAFLMVYIYLRMMTLYPALFDNSYRWAWFAGSALWVLIVASVGRIAAVLIALFLLRKYFWEILTALQRARFVLAAVLAVIVVGVAGWWATKRHDTKPPTNNGPNVILIALDSLRPDHVSWKRLGKPYGPRTTPNIDRFLDDAVWFDQAFVSLCRTYPSWISFLTGCWPPTHGVRDDLPPKDEVLPRVPTLAQVLQGVGYKTAFFLDNTNFAWIEPELGFDEIVQPPHNVIDFYVSSVQPPMVLYYYFLNNRLGYLYDPGLRMNAAYRPIYRPEIMNHKIARFLDRMRYESKFFAAIHFCSIHVPFCVSYPYSTYFAPSFGPVVNRFGYGALRDQILMKQKGEREEFSPEETSWIFTQEVNLYDALVRSADNSFGITIRAIQEAGLYDNSYIVLTADHAENLPEPGLRYLYGSSTHGFFLWGDGDTHVPLAIKFPNQRHAGRRVARLVRSIDLAPTLLESLGLPPLEKAEGVSRMPGITGGNDDRERWVYAEVGLSTTKVFIRQHLAYQFVAYPDLHEVDPQTLKIYKKKQQMPNLIAAKDRMIRTERWKLISYPIVTDDLHFKTELFDLATDRNSCNDISTSYPEVTKELWERLQPYIEKDLKEYGTGPLKAISDEDRERALTTRF